jgi:heme A synthase
MTKVESRSHLFTTTALATALLTIGLIVFGAVVRVTDSGLGRFVMAQFSRRWII